MDVDKKIAGSGLALVAMGLMLAGVLTNSWWTFDQGRVSSSVGLLKNRTCYDIPGRRARTDCDTDKHADARKNMAEFAQNWPAIRQQLQQVLHDSKLQNRAVVEEFVEAVDRLAESAGRVNVTLGDSAWISLGKTLFYGTFAVLLLMAVVITISHTVSEDVATVALAGAIACFVALMVSIAFVYRVPDYIKAFDPTYRSGYSRWLFYAGAVLGTSACVLLRQATQLELGGGRTYAEPSSQATPASARRSKNIPTQPTCPKCGGHASFREDVSCYICDTCRTVV